MTDTATQSEGLAPVRRGHLHDQLVGELRDLIVEGELPAGSRISERELCARFGISRTPLREALKVLAREGVVELLPHRGARVAALSTQDIDDMFAVMGALEALSGRLACARITEPEHAEIRALHFEMLAAYARGQRPEYFKLNQAIHEAILAASGNPVLQATYLGLAGRIRRARYLANLSSERWRAAVDEHEAMLAALERRDGDALAALLERHLKNKAAVVHEAIELPSP
jgi:DNA-binding GntR family transcriptional regulator